MADQPVPAAEYVAPCDCCPKCPEVIQNLREAWLRAEARVERARAEVRRLKRQIDGKVGDAD